ncbi:hypothetical protein COLO4_31151 [Corchorus olitorius]|uniref:Uncharacterized protein n=1 Tax=Corchorus olitorius TaxID=93759 RepID=A0A1R3H5N1_9ROSI|nr:hypothetical protein COLO4_31151 [Corchorus olitorius]
MDEEHRLEREATMAHREDDVALRENQRETLADLLEEDYTRRMAQIREIEDL